MEQAFDPECDRCGGCGWEWENGIEERWKVPCSKCNHTGEVPLDDDLHAIRERLQNSVNWMMRGRNTGLCPGVADFEALIRLIDARHPLDVLLPEICQLLDTARDDFMQRGLWTDWDQSVRDRITAYNLKRLSHRHGR
jgi:hypothetical protein